MRRSKRDVTRISSSFKENENGGSSKKVRFSHKQKSFGKSDSFSPSAFPESASTASASPATKSTWLPSFPRQAFMNRTNFGDALLGGITPAREQAMQKISLMNERLRLRDAVPDEDSEEIEIEIEKTTDDNDDGDDMHQTFGNLLADLTYKKVFLSSGRKLCQTVPIWALQRPLDKERVEAIAKAKLNKRVFPGVISVFDYEEESGPSLDRPQKFGIFDGQHRSMAVKRLVEDPEEEDVALIVEVYPVKCEEDIKRLFREVNMAENVQAIDLPRTLASPRKALIDEACEKLKEKYEPMFGNARSRPPNIHLHTLRNQLFEADVTSEAPQIKSANDLFSAMEECNQILAAKPHAHWPKHLHRNLPKAKRHSFFLGLSKNWIETILKSKVIHFQN